MKFLGDFDKRTVRNGTRGISGVGMVGIRTVKPLVRNQSFYPLRYLRPMIISKDDESR